MWEDKGPSFVKMNKEQYLKAGEDELANQKFYKQIDNDLSKEVKVKNDIVVDSMIQKDEIPVKVGGFLKDGQSKVARYYHLLKTHKIPQSVDNPSEWLDEQGFPIRGIVSCCGTPTERLAGFVDHFLQPGMQNLDTFLKDTKHTLQIIENINDEVNEGKLSLEGVAVVSLDVENMYNNMSEDLATEACKEFVESEIFQQDGESVSANSILTALDLCLKNNFFCFNDKVYKQISGVGTGVKLAPTYACLGLGKFEKLVFTSNQTLLEKIILWKRFIDDVFMLFRGTKSECGALVDWLNSLLPGVVKFKFDFSHSKIEFLDLEISIEDGYLKTNLYIKPSNKQLYLDYNSNHPLQCKQSIPYSQALRVVERCATTTDRDFHLDNLKGKLEARNYPVSVIEKQFEKAKEKPRKSLIFNQRKNCKENGAKKVRLMFTHTQANPPIHMWIRQSKKLLSRNDKAKEIGGRIQIGSRQPKNLQRIIGGCKGGGGGAKNTPPDAGCWKCNRCKVACPILKEGNRFKSTNTGKSYPIRQKVDCISDWVIYLVTCRRCQGQYVGKSKTEFRRRHSNHKQEIKKKVGGLGHHYGSGGPCSYEHVQIQIIEQVQHKNLDFLAERELHWQHQLRVYIENGGRAHCYRKDF